MTKKNVSVWGARFKNKTSNLFQELGSSIEIDKRLYKEDIMGSIVHTSMLAKQKIIDQKKAKKIIKGLNKINSEIKRKKFIFKKKYEDIHLNIEKRLFELIGDDAGYLHIARSRNDQVITDFKMWLLSSTNQIVNNLNTLIKTIIKKADQNLEIIMPGLTHLKNAQPILFSHYLFSTDGIKGRERWLYHFLRIHVFQN